MVTWSFPSATLFWCKTNRDGPPIPTLYVHFRGRLSGYPFWCCNVTTHLHIWHHLQATYTGGGEIFYIFTYDPKKFYIMNPKKISPCHPWFSPLHVVGAWVHHMCSNMNVSTSEKKTKEFLKLSLSSGPYLVKHLSSPAFFQHHSSNPVYFHYSWMITRQKMFFIRYWE